MNTFDRRKFFLALTSTSLLSACGLKSKVLDTASLDNQVKNTLQFLYKKWPEIKELSEKAVGFLVIPKISEASLVYGGSYGKGALLVGDKTVDYYSFVAGSWGLNFGIQQYSHALLFMTEDSLSNFKNSSGFNFSAELTYALQTDAYNLGVDLRSRTTPIIPVVFAQGGLMGGISLEGTKYNKLTK